MNEKILLINDIPGYGKVALAAMMPILAHMKYDVYNLPTAVVSNTLDYGKFDILETTEYMKKALQVWDELGFSFDAVTTGCAFLSIPSWAMKDICIMAWEQKR